MIHITKQILNLKPVINLDSTWILGIVTAFSGVTSIIVKIIQDAQSNKLKIMDETIKQLQTQIDNYEGQLDMMVKLLHEKDKLIEVERAESSLLRAQNQELKQKIVILEGKVSHLESLMENDNK